MKITRDWRGTPIKAELSKEEQRELARKNLRLVKEQAKRRSMH